MGFEKFRDITTQLKEHGIKAVEFRSDELKSTNSAEAFSSTPVLTRLSIRRFRS